MQVKLAEAKRRLVTLTARKRVADLQVRINQASDGLSCKGRAFAKFNRMREKVQTAEAQADAMSELNRQGDMDPDLSETEPQARADVETELAELKKKTVN